LQGGFAFGRGCGGEGLKVIAIAGGRFVKAGGEVNRGEFAQKKGGTEKRQRPGFS